MLKNILQPVLALCFLSCCLSTSAFAQEIQPAENPFYWEYQGQQQLLLGSSNQDDFYQYDFVTMTGKLDTIALNGGNYIRNVMASRLTDGYEVSPFDSTNGIFDLDVWNPEYWNRFDDFLAETQSRGIIIELELWATWDFYDPSPDKERWKKSPWNPDNNTNYTTENTQLDNFWPFKPKQNANPFFLTVPDLNNDISVLPYQEAFMRKLLSYTLNYDHVLYDIDNETDVPFDWTNYWIDFVHAEAIAVGKSVYTSEMIADRETNTIKYQTMYNDPARFQFIPIAQTTHQVGENHYGAVLNARNEIVASGAIRPMTVDKIYGSEEDYWGYGTNEAIDRFWRGIFAGQSSARFHRPIIGLGGTDTSFVQIRSMRMLEDKFDVMAAVPSHNTMLRRGSNEAFLLKDDATHVAVFFPAGGDIKVKLASDDYQVQWLDINQNTWLDPAILRSKSGKMNLTTPSAGKYVAVIRPAGEQLAIPTATPLGGTYAGSVDVSLSSSNTGASIFYTLSAGDPDQVYIAPITISTSATLRFKATHNSFADSDIASESYVINLPPAETPTATPAGGTYTSAQTVSLSTGTAGATIFYTFGAGDPDQVYSTPIAVTSSSTLRFKATAAGFIESAVGSESYVINLPPAETPTATPAGGTYTSAQTVSLSTGTAGATIFYTFGAGDPDLVYATPIDVQATSTLRFKSTAAGFTESTIGSESYTINLPPAETPTTTPAGGTYTAAQTVSLSTGTAGATIFYTFGAGDPDQVYSTPIEVTATSTLRFKSTASGFTESPVGSESYIINLPPAETPTATPAGGTYTAIQSVSLSTGTTGATIFYTFGAGDPDQVYSTPIAVNTSSTLRFKSTAAGFTESAVGSESYTINLPPAETPTATPAGGTYTAAQTVSLSTGTTGATIFYTLGAGDPDQVYSTPIPVNATSTLRFKSTASGFTESAVGSESYTINLTPVTEPLPAGWKHSDIGNAVIAGDAYLSNGNIRVEGSGKGIGGRKDGFHFAYQNQTGNIDFKARLESLESNQSGAKIGIMIREDIKDRSRMAMMYFSPTTAARFMYRQGPAAYAAQGNPTGEIWPNWIRITRVGTLFTGYVSSDGINWTEAGHYTISMRNKVFVGYAVSGKNELGVAQFTFDANALTNQTASLADFETINSLPDVEDGFVESYPNPFNPLTQFAVDLKDEQHVTVAVYNMLGQRVALLSDDVLAGNTRHWFTFDGAGFSSGLYLIRVQGKTIQYTRRITMVK